MAEELNRLAEKYLGLKNVFLYENQGKEEVRRSYLDTTKAKEVLGFEQKYELGEDLERTILRFLKNKGLGKTKNAWLET